MCPSAFGAQATAKAASRQAAQCATSDFYSLTVSASASALKASIWQLTKQAARHACQTTASSATLQDLVVPAIPTIFSITQTTASKIADQVFTESPSLESAKPVYRNAKCAKITRSV